MNYGHFGDTYDIVKRSILQSLSPCGGWFVHPMFTDRDPKHYAKSYCRFLGIPPVTAKTFSQSSKRSLWIAEGNACQGHLFVDPDKGLPFDGPTGRPRPMRRFTQLPGRDNSVEKFLMADELVDIVQARPDKLTLLFDQSFSHDIKAEVRIKQIKDKLRWLEGGGRDIRGFAFKSQAGHATFFLTSKHHDLLVCAKHILLGSSNLPRNRLIEI